MGASGRKGLSSSQSQSLPFFLLVWPWVPLVKVLRVPQSLSYKNQHSETSVVFQIWVNTAMSSPSKLWFLRNRITELINSKRNVEESTMRWNLGRSNTGAFGKRK